MFAQYLPIARQVEGPGVGEEGGGTKVNQHHLEQVRGKKKTNYPKGPEEHNYYKPIITFFSPKSLGDLNRGQVFVKEPPFPSWVWMNARNSNYYVHLEVAATEAMEEFNLHSKIKSNGIGSRSSFVQWLSDLWHTETRNSGVKPGMKLYKSARHISSGYLTAWETHPKSKPSHKLLLFTSSCEPALSFCSFS